MIILRPSSLQSRRRCQFYWHLSFLRAISYHFVVVVAVVVVAAYFYTKEDPPVRVEAKGLLEYFTISFHDCAKKVHI